ncbi:MAG: DUF4097 domain-containing protein [Verrucomicrobiota bacterium]|nr:DUF4097 domain-containing protein [Verrucomicrobiota bacterium]
MRYAHLSTAKSSFARAAFVLVSSVATVAALTTDNVSQQLDVTAGGKLIVDVEFGNVEVSAGAENKADVQAERKIDSDDEAREKEYVAAAPITITHEGNVVTVRARRQDKRTNSFSWHHVNMDARYRIQVPKGFDAQLRTGGGNITASDLIGTMKADTGGGKLKFRQLRGTLNGKTSGGSVEVHGCEGPLTVSTSGGGIDAAGGSGKIAAHTSGGSISVQDFSGEATVETSGGKLTLVNINGPITGRTAGGSVRATLAAPVPGDVQLETSAGSIDIIVPENAAFDIDAEASAGRVISDLPFAGEESDGESLHGRINGGGKSLQLRSGAGSITIRAAGKLTSQL